MSELCEIICITCPKGCRVDAWEQNGEVHIKGKICKKGKVYVQQEFREPRRILTTTMIVDNSSVRRLAVRTVGAIPKKDLFRSLALLSKIKITPPVSMGDIIVKNIAANVDVIASDNLSE